MVCFFIVNFQLIALTRKKLLHYNVGAIIELEEIIMKHGPYYTCKRLKLLEWLLDAGFEPIKTIPDPYNWKYRHWLFQNSDELEAAIEKFFELREQ